MTVSTEDRGRGGEGSRSAPEAGLDACLDQVGRVLDVDEGGLLPVLF